ncbi:MAG: hypothetical protein HY863_20420 [Chloroflexi bacterium]|nr:hypothetical protein [Chloroflexota bacterium]
MDTVNFMGHECVSLENEIIQLLISRSIGPRILSLRFAGAENVLAELPDFVTDCPGSGTYHFYGGHRLWHAPEIPSRTYQPDDAPVEICPAENGLVVTQNVESKTGMQKSMEIYLPSDAPQVVITHRLSNHGLWPVTSAPWAITQLRPGGVAILPQSHAETRELPNRTLTLWPYTSLSNPNVSFGRHHILVRAEMNEAFKVGFPNPRGWLAYWLDGVLFVKRANYEARSAYFDFGSSSECYCNDQFIELETLAPISTIEPGATVAHVETWELFKDIDPPREEKDVQVLVEKLGLEK